MRDSSESERREAAQTDNALVAVVDDDASVRQSTCQLIRSFGHRAESFASGAEFLRSEIAAQADCLLLDVRMPDMDGLCSPSAALALHPFITGRAMSRKSAGAAGAAAQAFFSQATLGQGPPAPYPCIQARERRPRYD
jgi:CheY-like chemotaxis protein